MATSTTARRLGKRQRQHLVAQLVEGHAVHNQGELVELLADHGVSATQSTVSRDLEELGAIKVRVPGGHTAYAIPELPAHQVAPLDQLRRVCADWVVDVDVSMNLVVVRTPPGSAHVVAAALDRASLAGVLGTVAGDDTLLVVADEARGGGAVADELRRLAQR
ncbi:MAG: arginine repressor [Acidimicrobiales bacterium]|nr:arginine repressor [Acidimicrobiales bacterium]MCB1259810.1 arginine repressor [Acidimicrobiales bacterium]